MRILAAAAVLLVFASAAAAQQKSLFIEDFHADIHVFENGSIDVAENIRVRFTGEWNGIRRNIPVRYVTPQGLGKRMYYDVVGATNQDGRELKVERDHVDGELQLRIWVPGAEDATHTVRLNYVVRNALLFFDDHDELYWSVTGNEWEMPIERASARVFLPRAVAGIRTTSYLGPYGSTAAGPVGAVDENVIDFVVDRPLRLGEGLTIVAGWAPGVVARPSAAARAGWFAAANWPFALPVLVFALMYRLWSVRGRDPRLRPVTATYEPPESLTPAELGALMDMRVDMRDITATLVDLAVRGFLRIEEIEKPSFLGIGGGSEYVFHRLKAQEERTLADHERRLLRELFACGTGDTVDSSDLKNEFYREVPEIRNDLYRALVRRGYYRNRPDRVRAVWSFAGLFITIAAFPLGGAIGAALGMGLTPAIAGVLSGLTVLFFGWHMPARTHRGSLALERVLGFEEFLRRVEKDRLDRVLQTPETFERILPYAMALGVEERWARAFRDVYTEPPQWYTGHGWSTFDARSFTSSLARMNQSTGQAMASAPRSSGSSGFGGGGFSGGGGGGGGGGGF